MWSRMTAVADNFWWTMFFFNIFFLQRFSKCFIVYSMCFCVTVLITKLRLCIRSINNHSINQSIALTYQFLRDKLRARNKWKEIVIVWIRRQTAIQAHRDRIKSGRARTIFCDVMESSQKAVGENWITAPTWAATGADRMWTDLKPKGSLCGARFCLDH